MNVLQTREPGHACSPGSQLQLVFLGLLSISFIGYFVFREHWLGYVFGLTAAVSIVGFYGCLAGAIAHKKRRSYARAFRIGFFVPMLLGVISAFLLAPWGDGRLPLTCGGWATLAAGLVVVITYLFVTRKSAPEQGESLA